MWFSRLAVMGSYNNSDKGMMASTSLSWCDDGRGMKDHTKDNSRRRLKGRHYSDGCQLFDGLERMEGGGHEDSIHDITHHSRWRRWGCSRQPIGLGEKRVQRTIANPPHGFDHKEHHLTDVWPWRSKREQKNEGRDKWNWRERWNCESLWFSVSIELKHGTKGSLLGWCLVHQFVNQDDISGVKIMTRHQIWHASPDMTVTWDSSAKRDYTGLLM